MADELPAGKGGERLFARYAYAPNHLGYCGPADSAALAELAATGHTDADVRSIASRFSGVWPYLSVLAELAGIADPLDERVVRAYWTGSSLLDEVDRPRFWRNLLDRIAAAGRAGHAGHAGHAGVEHAPVAERRQDPRYARGLGQSCVRPPLAREPASGQGLANGGGLRRRPVEDGEVGEGELVFRPIAAVDRAAVEGVERGAPEQLVDLRVVGKGEKTRTVPLHAKLREALTAWLAERPDTEDTSLFVTRIGTRPTAEAVNDVIASITRTAGLDEHVTVHVLRHCFGTNLVRDGVDLPTVADLMGHARLETTRRYSAPSADDLVRAIAGLPVDA